MANDDLAELRKRFAGCESIVLADISTGTVLASDSAIHVAQEHHDALCRLAALVFPTDYGEDTLSACVLRPTGVRAFIRLGAGSPEVICGIFAPWAERVGFDEAARALLSNADAVTGHV